MKVSEKFILPLFIVLSLCFVTMVTKYFNSFDGKAEGKVLKQEIISANKGTIKVVTLSYKDINDSTCQCEAQSSNMSSYRVGDILPIRYISSNKTRCIIESLLTEDGVYIGLYAIIIGFSARLIYLYFFKSKKSAV